MGNDDDLYKELWQRPPAADLHLFLIASFIKGL